MTSPDPTVQDIRRKEVVLATADELRDRIRQTGKAVADRDARLDAVRAVVQRHCHEPGALLPILHAVQELFGHVPADAVGEIAEGLNLSRAEVHGVLTFYHHFHSTPGALARLEICRAESCRAMGSEALWEHACLSLGLEQTGGKTADGAVSVESVYCLGLCAQSPSVALDGQPHAKMTPARLNQLLRREAISRRLTS